MRTLIAAAAMLVLFAMALGGHWMPLGLPSEWDWERLGPDSLFKPAPWFVFALSFVLAAAIAATSYRLLDGIDRLSRGRFAAVVAVVCLLGCVFQLSVEIASPAGLAKWCMFAGEGADGYYRHVRRHVPTVQDAIRGHAGFCEQHCYPHLSTNPAGWVVVHRMLLSFYEAHPELARAAFKLELEEMTQGYEELVHVRLPYVDRAALLSIAYGSRIIAWFVGLPAAWLVSLRFGRGAALTAAAASYLVPASIMFAPRSDTVYATFAALILALSYYAAKRSSWAAAGAAAALVAAGMMFSLCFSVVAVMASILVGLEFLRERRVAAKPMMAAIAAFAAVLLLTMAFGYSPFRTWLANLECNEKIIGDRSAWLWAMVNPLEMAVAMGLPAAVFLLGRILADLRDRKCDSLLIGWLTALLVLNFSGASLGEVARLWIFAMPVGVALGVERLDLSSRRGRLVIGGFLLLQAISCIMLSRDLVVVGFA